jgi:hypothetical protein
MAYLYVALVVGLMVYIVIAERRALARHAVVLEALEALKPAARQASGPVADALRDPEFRRAIQKHGRELLRARLAAKGVANSQ